jgi:hypothetical protein
MVTDAERAFEVEQFINNMMSQTPYNWTIASRRVLMLYAMAYVLARPPEFQWFLRDYLNFQLEALSLEAENSPTEAPDSQRSGQ